MMRSMTGRDALLGVLGPFRLYARLESACAGVECYAARRHPSGEAARLDRIDPRLTARREDRARILDAARLVADVFHPNVIQLIELAESGGAVYMVREQVAGRTLDAVLEQLAAHDRRLPEWLALHVAAEILTALTAVHARGVAHGAVEARNVVLSDRGEVKVDGALLDGAMDPSRPKSAPEGVVSQQADLFCVGVLLQDMLGGRPASDRPAEHRRSPSARMSALRPDLEALVRSLLDDDPERRPHGALAALADVMACAGLEAWSHGPDEVATALARVIEVPTATRPALARVASYVGRALPAHAAAYATVPLIPRSDMQWSADTGDFAQVFVPPRPSVTPALEHEPLLVLTMADGRVEHVFDVDSLYLAWRRADGRPRLVARPGTDWSDAESFAALAGLDVDGEDGAPLRAVTHVGDLGTTSLLSLLAELARARATGRLMIMDPAEPQSSRRTITLLDGTIARVGSSDATHQLPAWLMRGGYVGAAELGSLFREVLRSGRSILELVAQRRRETPARLWAKAWTDKLADPLATRRGRFAFDATAVNVAAPRHAPSAAGLLIDAARRAKTPEELRQWAAARRSSTYAVAPEFELWTRTLALDERLLTLARELGRQRTLDEAIRRLPGDAGAIILLAFLFHETRNLTFAA